MDLYGGAETLVVQLARYFERKGVDNTILALSSAPHQEYKGLNIITPPKGHSISYRIRSEKLSHVSEIIKTTIILRNLVSRYINDFDVVNPHNFPSVWAIPPGRKRTVWMCNEIPDLWHSLNPSLIVKGIVDLGRLADRWIVNRRVDKAVVSDSTNAQHFQKRYGLRPQVIPYGIEGSFFAQKPAREEEDYIRSRYGLGSDGFHIVHAGMISPSKNQFETIKATEKLRERSPKVRAILAGYKDTSRYASFLEEYARKKELGDSIIFTGHLSKQNLRALYHVSHVAVLPGRGQGSWLSPFEALATGRPIIVSSKLTCSTLIKEKDLGIVSDSLESALLDVHDRYKYHLDKARKGQEFVLKELTWDRFCERFQKILHSVR